MKGDWVVILLQTIGHKPVEAATVGVVASALVALLIVIQPITFPEERKTLSELAVLALVAGLGLTVAAIVLSVNYVSILGLLP